MQPSRTDTPNLRVPLTVRLFGPILKFLLEARVPLGPNRLVVIRGRKSGELRRTPIAVLRVDGRRFVWAPWGEVNWVRNLRAAGRATIIERNGQDEVMATELDAPHRVRVLPRHSRAERTTYPIRLPVRPPHRRRRSQPS